MMTKQLSTDFEIRLECDPSSSRHGVSVYQIEGNRKLVLFGNYDTHEIPSHLPDEEFYKIAKEVLKLINQMKAGRHNVDKWTKPIVDDFLWNRIDELVNKFFNIT